MKAKKVKKIDKLFIEIALILLVGILFAAAFYFPKRQIENAPIKTTPVKTVEKVEQSPLVTEKVSTDTLKLEEPMKNALVGNPFVVTGTAKVFEATFRVRVSDDTGQTLANAQIVADNFNWGNFEKSISYKTPTTSIGRVTFYYSSPKDGSEVVMGTVPVRFK